MIRYGEEQDLSCRRRHDTVYNTLAVRTTFFSFRMSAADADMMRIEMLRHVASEVTACHSTRLTPAYVASSHQPVRAAHKHHARFFRRHRLRHATQRHNNARYSMRCAYASAKAFLQAFAFSLSRLFFSSLLRRSTPFRGTRFAPDRYQCQLEYCPAHSPAAPNSPGTDILLSVMICPDRHVPCRLAQTPKTVNEAISSRLAPDERCAARPQNRPRLRWRPRQRNCAPDNAPPESHGA